jgi:phosphatidylserine decarboxylase
MRNDPAPRNGSYAMTIIDSVRKSLVPIHPEGYIFITVFAIVAFLLHWISPTLGWLGAIATAWCVYFFRDPPRVTPLREGLVVSPADGIICSVGFFLPPPELGLGADPLQRVSIFMSVFDCHVNRAPITGRISKIAYKPGLFVNADLDKASEDNERNGVVIDTPSGRFGVVQIAGLIARRIVCFVHEGESIGVGDRFGLIRFGSRVDVYMPSSTRPTVAIGSRAVAGETILADLNARANALTFKAG